jgi:hypothetical protein
VSAGNEEIGNGLAGGEWTTLPDSFEDGEMVSVGTFAMGFTNRVPLLNSMQPTHGTEKDGLRRCRITMILFMRLNSVFHPE